MNCASHIMRAINIDYRYTPIQTACLAVIGSIYSGALTFLNLEISRKKTVFLFYIKKANTGYLDQERIRREKKKFTYSPLTPFL